MQINFHTATNVLTDWSREIKSLPNFVPMGISFINNDGNSNQHWEFPLEKFLFLVGLRLFVTSHDPVAC